MLHCTQCGRAVGGVDRQSGTVGCVSCGARHEIQAFPALLRGAKEGKVSEGLQDESDAACFEHGDKKAIGACSDCGRFLCGLCEVEMGDDVLCFECFSKSASADSKGALKPRTVLYDSIALGLAIVPMIMIWPTLVTAPLVLFMCFRYWKRSEGLVPRSKARFVVAGVLAALQLTGWALLAATTLTAWTAAGGPA